MLCALILMVALSASLLIARGSAQQGDRIVTLGADLTEAQRNEVLRLLGASRQDRTLEVTTEETIRGSRGIIEIAPGTPSISSTAITCRPEGTGIQVRTRNIEAVTAGMYAQALLTAGITDASLVVAAPEGAPAEGLTALTGIFKAYRLSPCTTRLDPQRERLAQQELAITADLGEALGDQQAAASAVLNTQEQVVSRKLRTRAEIQQVVDSQLQNQESQVPAALRSRLVNLMVRLGSPIDWGGYSQGWQLQRIDQNRVSISARPAQAATPGATGTAGPGATATGAAGSTLEGTVQNVAAGGISVTTAGGATEAVPLADDVEVVRNDQPATLADIQPNDRVTVERDATGRATRIVAASTDATAATTGTAPVPTGTAAAAETTPPTDTPATPPVESTEVATTASTADPEAGASPTAPVLGQSGGIISGTVTGREGNALNIRTGAGTSQNVPLTNVQNLSVTRNGAEASVGDIQEGDEVTVTLGSNGVPRSILATSAAAPEDGGGYINWLWCLLGLLLLLPLLFLLLRRRRAAPATVRSPFVVSSRASGRRRRDTPPASVKPMEAGTTEMIIRPSDDDSGMDGTPNNSRRT